MWKSHASERSFGGRKGEGICVLAPFLLSSIGQNFPHKEFYSLTLPLITQHPSQPLAKPDLMFCGEVLHLNLDVTGRAGDYECVADRPQKVGFYGSTQNVSAMAIAKAKQSQPGSKTQVSLREPVEANKMSTEEI